MIHAVHAHAHVGHGQDRARTERRNWRGHTSARCQRRTAKPRAVDRLADETVSTVARRDDNVEGFRDAHLELVDRHRTNILAIGLDDRHRQIGDTDVEVGLRGGIDDPQPHPLAGREQPSPIVKCSEAVDGIIIG